MTISSPSSDALSRESCFIPKRTRCPSNRKKNDVRPAPGPEAGVVIRPRILSSISTPPSAIRRALISALLSLTSPLIHILKAALAYICLLYTSDAADEEDSVDLGGRRIIKKKKHKYNK